MNLSKTAHMSRKGPNVVTYNRISKDRSTTRRYSTLNVLDWYVDGRTAKPVKNSEVDFSHQKSVVQSCAKPVLYRAVVCSGTTCASHSS